MLFDTSLIALLLTMLGIAQLSADFCSTRMIVRELPAKRQSWRVLGALIALFAVGYLRDLRVDSVKIDGRFVREIANSDFDASIIKAINEISHASGSLSVAEFVEEGAGLAALKLMGVDCAQGYYFGRPEILSKFLQRADRKSA